MTLRASTIAVFVLAAAVPLLSTTAEAEAPAPTAAANTLRNGQDAVPIVDLIMDAEEARHAAWPPLGGASAHQQFYQDGLHPSPLSASAASAACSAGLRGAGWGSAAATDYLPCILNNGCVCNHTLPYFNWKDFQFYGTCVKCGTEDYTGPTCSERLVECHHFGKKVNGTCQCTPEFSGLECDQHMCLNSKDGVGNYSVERPDWQNYCRNCKDGYEGVTCAMCTADEACDKGHYCSRDPMFLHNNHKMSCAITDELILDQLEWGRRKIAADIVVNCSSGSGWAHPRLKDGNCTVTLYRQEFIDKPAEMYVDPFFFCTMFQCSVTEREVRTQAPPDEDRDRTFRIIRDIGMSLLLVLALCVSVAKYVPVARRHRKLPVRASLAALAIGLVIYVIALECFMVSSPTITSRKVTLHCDQASCTCAPDSRLINNSYAPNCNETTFANLILPNMKGNIDVHCEETGECSFEPRDLSLSIPLHCKHSECVNASAVPRRVTEEEDNGAIPAMAAGASIAVLSVAVLLHYLVCRYRSRRAAEEFANDQFVLGGSGCFSSGLASPMFSPLSPGGKSPFGGSRRGGGGASSKAAATAAGRTAAVNDPSTASSANNTPPPSTHPSALGNQTEINRNTVNLDAAPLALKAKERAEEEEGKGAIVANTKPLTTCRLTVEKLRYTVRTLPWPQPFRLTPENSKQILFDISLSAKSGDVVALMGASGAGKTTLLDILAARGKMGQVGGAIRLNGSLVSGNCERGSGGLANSGGGDNDDGGVGSGMRKEEELLSKGNKRERRRGYRGLVGYVSQEDTLLPHLTVRQTLRYAAMLKLPTAFTAPMIARVVDDVIESLKLTRCADTIVGDGHNTRGLSGGEKRRVSIGVELVANPRILFLDEPTSGLDAANALNVMEVVAEVAKSSPLRRHAPNFFSFNPIVIASIHQPSRAILRRFTKVVLLSRGQMVYSGPAEASAAAVLAQLPEATANAISRGAEGDDNPAEVLLAVDDHISAEERSALAAWAREGERKAEEEQRQQARQRHELREGRFAADVDADAATLTTALLGSDEQSTQQQESPTPKKLRQRSAAAVPPPLLRSPSSAEEEGGDVIASYKASKRFYMHIYSQFGLLVRRAHSSLMGAYYLVAAHGFVAFVMGLLMCFLYESQPLTLPGTLNRAGSVTFLLLVQSFISLSALEQLMTEKKLFVTERENGFYTTLPYLASKVVVDILPLRIIPSVFVSSLIYFPMGLRMDDGSHFLWFIFIVALFTCTITMLVVCIGAVSQSFGSAALVAAVLILWNFVFGGLLVQSQTIPEGFEPFKNVSPFYFAFEALMVNDLKGQMCEFSPTNDAGQPSDLKMPVHCTQYIYNLGLKPDRFHLDVALLAAECGALLVVAYILMTFVRVTR